MKVNGIVVALNEDGSATEINGNQSDNAAKESGAAYVFVRSDTSWSQQAYLKASNTKAGDLFGIAVAVAGDTLVVGAESEDGGAKGINGDQNDIGAVDSGAAFMTTPSNRAPPMCSCATARPGASRLISKPRTPRRRIISAELWGCGATLWWSAPGRKIAALSE